MNIKISVIIPVYNAEKYLSETLDSVLNQSFMDFEVIAINDGSKDDSLSILRKYEKKDKRIRVIDKPNTGVSDTRNVGIDKAHGEYICFVDADDLIYVEYLSIISDIIDKEKSDIIAFENITFREKNNCSYNLYNIVENISYKFLLETGKMTSCCTKVFKRVIIKENNIYFDNKMSYGEDLFFSWRVCLLANKIIYTQSQLYGYRLTGEGATSIFHKNLYEIYRKAFENIKRFAIVNNKIEETKQLGIYFVKRIPAMITMTVRENNNIKNKYNRIKQIIDDDIIKYNLNFCWDELIKNENKKNIKIYDLARKRKIVKLLISGIYKEKKRNIINKVCKWRKI